MKEKIKKIWDKITDILVYIIILFLIYVFLFGHSSDSRVKDWDVIKRKVDNYKNISN